MLEDAGGQIWASTADGIAKIDPERLSVQTLRAAEGVFIRGYWIDAAAMAADGSLLFGGEGGLTVLQPGRIQSSVAKQELVLTEGWVGDQAVALGRFKRCGLGQHRAPAPGAQHARPQHRVLGPGLCRARAPPLPLPTGQL